MDPRLNIGCGQSPTPGWLNYDNSPAVRLAAWPGAVPVLRALRLIDGGNAQFAAYCRSHGIRYANAVKHIPQAAGSVDAIYSSHMIEHLDRRLPDRRIAVLEHRADRPDRVRHGPDQLRDNLALPFLLRG